MLRFSIRRFPRLGWLFSLFLTSTLLVQNARPQQVSGSIGGVVRDAQGGFVAGARVIVINQQQGVTVRETTTSPQGAFFVSPLLPADYTIVVEAQGFKRYERRDVKLFANDRIGLPEIVLELGTVTETITVEAETVQLQTQSAERSGVVTGRQVVDLALNGRNYLDLLKTVPGIVSDFSGQVAGPGGIGAIYANGQRGNQNFLTLDGVSNMDTGSNGTQHTSLNIDSVAEFKVVTNAPQAEFGRSAGAQITIVTKSGTRDFHGTGYWFHRHEGLNANNWRNNVEGRARQLYRYNYQGYNIGGPVYIPGKFNTNRDKLFFFWGNEFQRQLVPNALRSVLVPTQAERNGNFSATREADGRPVTIFDPMNGLPFPGNIIPQNRIDPDGQRILNFYPLPNVADPPPNFNYQTQVSGSYPRDQYMGRVDYNINDHWRVFYRLIRDVDSQVMPYGQWSADNNLGIGPMRFGQPGLSMTANLTTVVNPTLTNEFIVGFSRNRLSIVPTDDIWSRQRLGLQFRMPFPGADPLGLVQNFQWGGVPNAPFSGFNGTPFFNVNNTFDFMNNLTKVAGRHSIKTGFFIQRSRKDQTAFTPVNGTINFGRDRANPGDTNWAYSNGLLGNFLSLTQSNIVRNGLYRYTNAEWYVQDTWRATDRLTFDYGIRFSIIQPQFEANLQTSSFNPQSFTQQDRVALFQPTADGRALNPLTGEVLATPFIGALVPGVGRFDNGMARAGLDGYPRGLIDSRGVHYGPRAGVAYQFMDKTVLRAGAGIVYDRFQGNPVFDMLPNPPSTLVPQFFYGNVQTVADTPGVLFPVNVRGFDRRGQVPTTYNWNASIQRELPFQLLLDVAYVGSTSRHLLSTFNLNEMPFGSAWLPQNQDPRAATPRLDGTTTLPLNLYRTYPGFGNITMTGFGAFSNYHSLQVGLNRRMRHGLIFGVAYTWGRALGVAGGDGDLMHPTDFRMANYGPLAFDRPHVLVFNYIYDVPGLGRNGNFLDNKVGRAVFNGWQVAGITSMQSGIPDFIFPEFQGIGNAERNRRLTGSETVAPRPVFVGPSARNRGDRNHYHWINTDAVRMPVGPSFGLESGSRPIRRPGVHNWDISVYKNFPLFREGQNLQVRLEMFNAPNHPQFLDFNRTAQFNINTGELTNLPSSRGGGGGPFGFGALTAARDPRIIQLATKIYF